MNHSLLLLFLLLSLLPTLTPSMKCYDKCNIVTSFTYGNDPDGWAKNSLMDRVSDKNSEYTVTSCFAAIRYTLYNALKHYY